MVRIKKETVVIGVVALLGILVVVSGCVGYRIAAEVAEQKPAIIAGTVSPPEEGIKAQLMQNYSIVAETFTDVRGNYVFSNFSEGKYGKYGLLFTEGELVYIYNDEINEKILNEEKNKVIVKENVIPSIFNYNINLSKETADYETSTIFLSFEYNISEDKINQLMNKYSVSIFGKGSAATIVYYIVDIPVNEVVLKVLEDLNLEQDIYATHYIPPGKKMENLALLSVTRKKPAPYIDPEIIEALKTIDEVGATVTMWVDNSWNRPKFGEGSTSKVFDEITIYNYELKRPVIESLNKNDFKIEGGLSISPVFYGTITKSGLEKLRNNSRVLMIEKSKGASISS